MLTVIAFLLVCKYAVAESNSFSLDERSGRFKRQLLFPNVTVLQLNIGLAIPLGIPDKTINLNLFFQSNFNMPWNWTQFPVGFFSPGISYVRSFDSIDSLKENVKDSNKENEIEDCTRDKREISKRLLDESIIDEDSNVHNFYRLAEEFLNSVGHNGSACVRRTLCEAAAGPIHSKDPDDILHEIASYILNPSFKSDSDEILRGYKEAAILGKQQGICEEIYPECRISLIDLFSEII